MINIEGVRTVGCGKGITINGEDFDEIKAQRDSGLIDIKRLTAEREALQLLLNERDEQLEAQRLRADTAEAERDGAMAANAVLREEVRTERLRADAAVGDANEAERMLAAAEQRIAVLKSALEGMLEYFPEGHSDGECFSVEAARAALNQKSEGESHAK